MSADQAVTNGLPPLFNGLPSLFSHLLSTIATEIRLPCIFVHLSALFGLSGTLSRISSCSNAKRPVSTSALFNCWPTALAHPVNLTFITSHLTQVTASNKLHAHTHTRTHASVRRALAPNALIARLLLQDKGRITSPTTSSNSTRGRLRALASASGSSWISSRRRTSGSKNEGQRDRAPRRRDAAAALPRRRCDRGGASSEKAHLTIEPGKGGWLGELLGPEQAADYWEQPTLEDELPREAGVARVRCGPSIL